MGFILGNPTQSKVSIASRPCGLCHGHGALTQVTTSHTSSGEPIKLNVTCPACGGLGYVYDFVVTAQEQSKG